MDGVDRILFTGLQEGSLAAEPRRCTSLHTLDLHLELQQQCLLIACSKQSPVFCSGVQTVGTLGIHPKMPRLSAQ
jgi:hypothetical protein